MATSRCLRRHIVVLDPGHGGADPGALACGIAEKNVVLRLAERAAHYIRLLAPADCCAHLTRVADYGLSIDSRVAMAVEARSSLFVSLHTNASANPAANGITCIISKHDSGRSRRLAERILKRVTGFRVRGVKPDSRPFIRFKRLGVLQGTHAHMPSVLIECGFLTNSRDRAVLTDAKRREIIALGIALGVCDYLGVKPDMQQLLPKHTTGRSDG